jgi:hypothetical protein
MATLDAGEYVSLYVKRAGQREAAEKARRAQLVTIPIHINLQKMCRHKYKNSVDENARSAISLTQNYCYSAESNG